MKIETTPPRGRHLQDPSGWNTSQRAGIAEEGSPHDDFVVIEGTLSTVDDRLSARQRSSLDKPACILKDKLGSRAQDVREGPESDAMFAQEYALKKEMEKMDALMAELGDVCLKYDVKWNDLGTRVGERSTFVTQDAVGGENNALSNTSDSSAESRRVVRRVESVTVEDEGAVDQDLALCFSSFEEEEDYTLGSDTLIGSDDGESQGFGAPPCIKTCTQAVDKDYVAVSQVDRENDHAVELFLMIESTSIHLVFVETGQAKTQDVPVLTYISMLSRYKKLQRYRLAFHKVGDIALYRGVLLEDAKTYFVKLGESHLLDQKLPQDIPRDRVVTIYSKEVDWSLTDQYHEDDASDDSYSDLDEPCISHNPANQQRSMSSDALMWAMKRRSHLKHTLLDLPDVQSRSAINETYRPSILRSRPIFPYSPSDCAPKQKKKVRWAFGDHFLQIIGFQDVQEENIIVVPKPSQDMKTSRTYDENGKWRPPREPSPHPICWVRNRETREWLDVQNIPPHIYEALCYYEPHSTNLMSIDEMNKILDSRLAKRKKKLLRRRREEERDRERGLTIPRTSMILRLQTPNRKTPVTEFAVKGYLREKCLQCLELGTWCDKEYPECGRCVRRQEEAKRSNVPKSEQEMQCRCIAMRSLSYHEMIRLSDRHKTSGSVTFPVRFHEDTDMGWASKVRKLHEVIENPTYRYRKEFKEITSSKSRKESNYRIVTPPLPEEPVARFELMRSRLELPKTTGTTILEQE